jgi:tRNA (guanine-N1)-methyltransferase
MLFRIFSLHTDIFRSFLDNGLIARGISKDIIKFELVNWREKFGVGNYKQVDDKPFGGGSGMVLMPDPIFKALEEYNAVSGLFGNRISASNLSKQSKDEILELENFLSELPEGNELDQKMNFHKKLFLTIRLLKHFIKVRA